MLTKLALLLAAQLEAAVLHTPCLQLHSHVLIPPQRDTAMRSVLWLTLLLLAATSAGCS